MSDTAGPIPPVSETPFISAARARLDQAVLSYNRHAIVDERDRLAIRRFRKVRRTPETEADECAALRCGRATTALHRATVRGAVGEFMRLLRDAGTAPETALIAAKARLSHSVTTATPDAPIGDAALLAIDLSRWAIKAYYDAA